MTQILPALQHGTETPLRSPDPRWNAVSRVIERLSAAQDFTEIAAFVTQAARSIVGADGVTFVLREGALCHYVEENAVGPLWKGQRFPLEACISGWSMINATTAVVPDVYADPRIPVSAYEPTFVRSLVMVPIGTGEALGAIGAYWGTKRSIDAETIALLELLARMAAPAVSLLQLKSRLSYAEERALRAHEVGGLGAWTIETEGCTLFASLIFKHQLGRAAAAHVSYADLVNQVHPDDREALRSSITNAADKGEDFSLACRILWADGSVHWLDLRADIVRDSRGNVAKLCGVSSTIDISSRRPF